MQLIRSKEKMEKTTYKTLQLPIELIQETEKIIQSGKASSFDEFVALALKHELLNLEQAENQIDLKSEVFSEDPIWELGENSVIGGVTNASENLDQYLYNSL
jgi:hypothetical protein